MYFVSEILASYQRYAEQNDRIAKFLTRVSMTHVERKTDAAIAETRILIAETEKFLAKAEKFRTRVEASILKEQKESTLNSKTRKNAKEPACKWTDEKNHTRSAIDPAQFNTGVLTGPINNLLVVDVDVKDDGLTEF
jgi:hypothetical protein